MADDEDTIAAPSGARTSYGAPSKTDSARKHEVPRHAKLEDFSSSEIGPIIISVIHKSKENAQHLITSSSHLIETNRWLLPVRYIVQIPTHWPRTSASVFLVIVPLWALICLSMAFGSMLADLERPAEVERNDDIIRALARISFFEVSEQELLNAPSVCLALWKLKVLGDQTSAAEFSLNTSVELLVNDTYLDTYEAEVTEALLNKTDPDGDGFILVNQTLLQTTLDECAPVYAPILQAYREAQQNNPEAFRSLSFTWIRCWDSERLGRPNRVFYPTIDQIYAAHPANQSAIYQKEWQTRQTELYQQFLPVNATIEDDYIAFEKSVEVASGGSVCEKNVGGTTWFFFTIMTTLGYGNQAPSTSNGRLLVVSGGLLCLILFGVVLGLCGYVVLAIFDDMVNRMWISRFLAIPFVGMLFWGTVWLAYALTIAADVQWWWLQRLPEFGASVTREDALWFAFISTSTIGLGDFFLQPEVLFASDTLKYSVLFMVGFVFLSNFFGKIVECLGAILPKRHNSLETRLKETRVLACWPRGWMPWDRKFEGVDGTGVEVVDMRPDDQALIYLLEQLNNLKPKPQTEPEDSERGFLNTMKGKATLSMNIELLDKQDELLRDWLTMVQQQKARALAHHEHHKRMETANEEQGKLEEGSPTNSKISNKAPPKANRSEELLKLPSTTAIRDENMNAQMPGETEDVDGVEYA